MTAMGVFWSITLLVVLLGAGRGIRKYMEDNLTISKNSSLLFANPTSMPHKGLPIGRYWSIYYDDMQSVGQSVEGLKIIIPFSTNPREETAYNGNRSFNTTLQSGQPEMQEINPVKITFGRFLNDIDMQRERSVAVIGESVSNALFGPGFDPTGEKIKIGQHTYQVVGVMKQISDMVSMGTGSRTEESIYTPFTTMKKRYHLPDRTWGVMMAAKEGYDISVVEKQVADRFRYLYDIHPEDTKAVYLINIKKQFDQFMKLFSGLDILILIIGIGTLLAGIVGISNIMLIVLKERTQEIGVRRALGATPMNIISQIMTESFILTFITGVMAMSFGIGVLAIAEQVIADSGIKVQVDFGTAMFSATIIIISGLLAGIIPATRAIAIKAVDAIREE